MTISPSQVSIETRGKNDCGKLRPSLYTQAPRYLLRSTEGGWVEPPPMIYLPKVNM